MAHLWVERVMTTLFGCSGPNAMSIITRNVECAALQAQLVTAILCLSLFAYLYGGRRGWFFPAIVCGMLAAHPLWILDPYRGDCGVALAQWATVVTALSVGAIIAQLSWVLARAARARRAHAHATD